ncbi:hypothetical protein [Pantoea brenneri]|nr:hypothetical protein [Pantoea brenneri]
MSNRGMRLLSATDDRLYIVFTDRQQPAPDWPHRMVMQNVIGGAENNRA